ncbi:DUF2326 domain-containing protein [Burkholderia cenocepacia]|uniref:DUF2326 domain-containing protein n=1 Tax=Burkholderia cenocepacia TaxID=95486 RepID=UPI002237B315|nr:DUF2326 domain-containing protein [Burkholderia cenocepacia]MCW5115580.1 DUF2326 domain-containing protein [Burkholderia cenocepacia]MCW5129034.1 DUF2326 domain-containing protein [Burkholderia cenocepacia]MCW5172042.1 DUF2326 domain-containing protein [Burkholderia cenocepacia]
MLRRLWSPTRLFDPIEFREGLNLIIGRYSKPRTFNDPAGINGIGKSSVVRLLDYLLLSEQQRKRFTSKKYGFLADEDHSVVLELRAGDREVTIRRTFGKAAKVVALVIDGQPEVQLDEKEARSILGPLLFPPSIGMAGMDGRMRSLLPFYIKDDLQAHDRVEPVKFLVHAGANERTMTVLTLYLLGLSNEALFRLEEQRTLQDNTAKLERALRKRVETETGKSIAALRSEMARAGKRADELGNALNVFNLFENFKQISEALADLESQAAQQRKAIEQSERQLAKIRRFVEITPEIDRNDVTYQYRQISEALGAAVRKTLDDVFAFRESLTHQRLRFHEKRVGELEALHAASIEALTQIEQRRSALMQLINTTRFEESIQDAVQRVIVERGAWQRERLMLDQIDQYGTQLSSFSLRMQEYEYAAILALSNAAENVTTLRERFLEIVQNAIVTSSSELEDAFLDIRFQTGAAARNLPVKISVSLPRADALGQTRLRLVAYDFTVFLHQIESGLPRPRFLVHDGAFHSIARRTVVKALNFMYNKGLAAAAKGAPFQYIATFNEDELTLNHDELQRDGSYDFSIDDVAIVRVGDTPEEMLFKRRF